MHRHPLPCAARLIVALLAVSLLPPALRGADAKAPDKKPELKPEGVTSGLMTDFKKEYMVVQLDDQDEPIQFYFTPGMSIQTLTKQGIFPCNRINFKYKTDGNDKIVLAAEKLGGRSGGIAIGTVIKVYNDFWVSIKPTNGDMIEGFALGGNAQIKPILHSLNPGDLVAIKYTTDFERHRIVQMEVKPAGRK